MCRETILFYSMGGGKKCEKQKLAEFVRSRLPVYMVPQRLQKFAELPLNENGKIDRTKLTAILKEILSVKNNAV